MYSSCQTEAGQVDLCSERRNESESGKYTRIVTSLLLEHSLPHLPETNLSPEKENVSLVARKEGEIVPRLHLGEPKPGPNIVGFLKNLQ